MGVSRLRVDQTSVLIVMTVNAEILPIAAIGWIVVVIMILVMYRQFMKVFFIELTATATADPWMNLEGLRPIALFTSVPGPDCIDHSLVESLFLVNHLIVPIAGNRLVVHVSYTHLRANETREDVVWGRVV